MTIGVIFKIAAVGILVSILSQVLKSQRKGRTGVSDKLCRSDSGIVLGAPIYL